MPLQDDGPSACIDENAVLDFVQGRLDRVEVARIDEHADGCLACRKAIDGAVRVLRERSTSVDNDPIHFTRCSVGDKLADRYRIVRFIARGGMGEVYEAEDEMLGTRIAMKTIAATIADNPQAARRLKQEVSLARRITHPNVCRIFDLGVHGGGTDRPGASVLFFTMELITGVSLAQRLSERGRFSTEAALPIVMGMAAALGAAHRAGVVHRDFKSDNIMLASEPDGERIVVTDFGLARHTATATQDSLEARGLEGTLAYMSPEQLEGQSARQPADIYALGLVMYEMLTGELPCAPKPGGHWLPAAWRRAVEPVPPVRSLVPEIDARWNDVIALCLQREIDRRPVSPDDVVRALVAEASDEPPAPAIVAPTEQGAPVQLAPSPAVRRAWPWKTSAAIGVAGILLAAGAINRRAPPRADVAVRAATESATVPAPAVRRTPESAPAPAAPQPLGAVPSTRAAAALPDTSTADLLVARRSSSAGHPSAPRPRAPRPAHHDQVTAPGAELSKDSPATEPTPAASQAPAPAHRRSADPNDGFIFKNE
ncbi:MAG TPA: protein kinase [Polyangia bacterium]|nr:protein kinase [Polyangia bacterium]